MNPCVVPVRLLVWGSGSHVTAAYDFVCDEPLGSVRMADVLGIEQGLIRSIEMFFDPRPFLVE